MYTQGKFKDGTKGWKVNKLGRHWNNKDLEHLEVVWSDDNECVCDTVYSEVDAKLISAAPEMFEALKRVEAYLVANEDVLAPFPTRSELDNIRATMFKTGLYQYGG